MDQQGEPMFRNLALEYDIAVSGFEVCLPLPEWVGIEDEKL